MRKLLFLLPFFLLSGCGMHTVETGHRGIKVNFGQVEGEPLSEGLYFVNPFTTTIVSLDTRQLRWDGKTSAYTKDVQETNLAFSLNYRLRQTAVGDVYKTVGTDWDKKIVDPVVYQSLKDVIGKWDAVDLIANRQQATDEIQKLITEQLDRRQVDVINFTLNDVQYTDNFDHAVEAKVIAQQTALAAQNKTEQIKQEAQQKVISATAEAQSMKIRADALQQNPRLVEWEAVQKWNGQLPQYSLGGALPFIQVPTNTGKNFKE